jgi:hypothetical protein
MSDCDAPEWADNKAKVIRHVPWRACCQRIDRLAHISHSPHKVDHLHILVSCLLLGVSAARVTDPTYWSSHAAQNREGGILTGSRAAGWVPKKSF